MERAGAVIPPFQGLDWVFLGVTLGDAQGCIIAAPLGLAEKSEKSPWRSQAPVFSAKGAALIQPRASPWVVVNRNIICPALKGRDNPSEIPFSFWCPFRSFFKSQRDFAACPG